jgi:hypothetical protein
VACQSDPVIGEDLKHAPKATERCDSASYEPLLSHRNRLDHGAINPRPISDI